MDVVILWKQVETVRFSKPPSARDVKQWLEAFPSGEIRVHRTVE